MMLTLERGSKGQNMFMGLNLTKPIVYCRAILDKIMNIRSL